MSIYEITHEPRGRIIRFHGSLSKDLIDRCHHETDCDPDYENCRYVIVDNRNIDDVSLTMLEGRMLGARDKVSTSYSVRRSLRMAHVIPTHLPKEKQQLYKDVHAVYGQTTKFDKLKVAFFETFEEAKVWATADLD